MDYFQSPEFTRRTEELMQKWYVPGVAVAVVDASGVASKAFGKASLDPAKEMTADTIFECASISKAFTGAVIAMLVHDDVNFANVKWTVPVSELLPDDFVLSEPSAMKAVTLEDIVSNRSGYPSHDWSLMGAKAKQPDTPLSVTRNLRNLPMNARPGATYQYCNMMLIAASHVAETIAGQPFPLLVQDRIFDPLGMTRSFIGHHSVREEGLEGQMSAQYVWRDNAYVENTYIGLSEGQGAANIKSSVREFAKWVQAMLFQQGPITKHLYRDLIKPRIITDADSDDLEPFTSNTAYALGWKVRFYRGYKVVNHRGQATGWSPCTEVTLLPEFGFGVVIFGNADNACHLSHILAHELIDAALGVPIAQRVDWHAYCWNRYGDDAAGYKSEDSLADELRRSLGAGVRQPTKLDHATMQSYVGIYTHAGYHDFDVTIRNEQLYIDASDRAFPFHVWFEHVCDNVFVASVVVEPMPDDKGEEFRAEFQQHDEKRTLSLGLPFSGSNIDEMIWFKRRTTS